jgi:hypothetical protein
MNSGSPPLSALLRALCCAASLAACGNGQLAVDGTVAGRALDAKDAVLHSVRNANGAVVTEILVADVDDLCAKMGNNPGLLLNGYTTLFFELGIFTPDGVVEAASSPGRFDVRPAQVAPGSRVALADFLRFGDKCGVDVERSAGSGTVTVTHAGPALASYQDELQEVAAEFDLTFEGGHLTGRFFAHRCPGWYAVAVACH